MRVAIIGAGVSGIAALKCCLEENLTAVCYEQGETFGGLWEHKSKAVPGETTVSRHVVCNTSKEMMAFSDFPPPKEFPLYMPHNKYKEYLELYVENFGLEQYMKFNTKVHKCELKEDKWWLKVEDLKTNDVHEEIFDALMICNGIFQTPNIPAYPGMSDFPGKILHVQEFRKPSDFADQRVLVIGLGNTGAETAVELSRGAQQVFASTINGKWFCKRLTSTGLAIDVHVIQRIRGLILKFLPSSYIPLMFRDITSFNHQFFGLNPKPSLSLQTVTMNDEIVDKISSGKVILKPNVEKFTAEGIQFVDGTALTDIDSVIFGTGYLKEYPFLDESMLKFEDGNLFAYKHMFPPELMDKNVAIIGCLAVFGSAPPVHETQCRLATRVFQGLVNLPSKEVAIKEIKATLTTQSSIDVIGYQDQLCELIGCKPSISDLLLTDPYLALNIFAGPCTPYQYRLNGSRKWCGAKSAINNQWTRMHYPTNKQMESKHPPWINDFLIFSSILFGISIIVLLLLQFMMPL